jgi:hypothetical protein
MAGEHAMGTPATAENIAGGARFDLIGVPFDGDGPLSWPGRGA